MTRRGRRVGLRVLRFVATFGIVSAATALILDAIPGDTAAYLAGENAPPEVAEAITRQYGLDDPFYVRYFDWVSGVLHGDLGVSYVTKQSVAGEIFSRLPVTLELALLATLLAFVVAIPLAMVCSLRPGSLIDRIALNLTTASTSIPAFVLGILLILVLAVKLEWFPVLGWVALTEDPIGNLQHAALPIITIAVTEIAVMFRVLRADMLETLQLDFVALARSKGMSNGRIMFFHVLRPSSFSLVTVAGVQFARALGGTVVVESIFALPGVGSLLIHSVASRDLIMLQGIVVFLAVAFLLVNVLVDATYGWLDPRSRVAA